MAPDSNIPPTRAPNSNNPPLKDTLDVFELNPDDPVESIFIECVRIYRERAKKYTDENWDDNFQFIARSMREQGHPEFKASDAAAVLKAVKDARKTAGHSSGRKDFSDDSFRDSDIDKINYSAIELALKDKEAQEDTMKDSTYAVEDVTNFSSGNLLASDNYMVEECNCC